MSRTGLNLAQIRMDGYCNQMYGVYLFALAQIKATEKRRNQACGGPTGAGRGVAGDEMAAVLSLIYIGMYIKLGQFGHALASNTRG
jgi:hypothetical protein